MKLKLYLQDCINISKLVVFLISIKNSLSMAEREFLMSAFCPYCADGIEQVSDFIKKFYIILHLFIFLFRFEYIFDSFIYWLIV